MSKITDINGDKEPGNSLLNSSLDALSSHVAILDRFGTIVGVNQSWRSFADSDGLGLVNYGLGANYFEVCESCRGSGAREAKKAAEGAVMIQTSEIPREELITRLRAVAAERESDRVYLRADGVVPYENVMQIMGALNRGGFKNIGLVTEPGGPSLDSGN